MRRPARPGKVSVLLTAPRPAPLCFVVRGLRKRRPRWQVRPGQFSAQRVRGLQPAPPVLRGLRDRRLRKRRRVRRTRTRVGARPT